MRRHQRPRYYEPPVIEEDLVTIEMAAERLGKTPEDIHKMIVDGHLRPMVVLSAGDVEAQKLTRWI